MSTSHVDTVYVCNKSTLVSNEHVRRMVSAVNHQLIVDFQPAYKQDARCKFLLADDGRDNVIYIFDDPDTAGALGYHDETPDGKVYGKVFARVDGQVQDLFGPQGMSVTLSHEVLELLGDPNVNVWVDVPGGAVQTCRELCDAVEGDAYQHADGLPFVSNFLWPDWFNPRAKSQVDQMGTCSGPFQFSSVSKGMNYMIVRKIGTGEKQIYGAKSGFLAPLADAGLGAHKAHPASRTSRRLALG